MSDPIEKKQQYLVAHIIDGGYDPNEFAEFMENSEYTEKGIDLSQWNFDELEKIVEDFKTLKNGVLQSEPNQEQDEDIIEVIETRNLTMNASSLFEHGMRPIQKQSIKLGYLLPTLIDSDQEDDKQENNIQKPLDIEELKLEAKK